MKYLEFLDISHNKLITLPKSIFGITATSSNLRIYAGYNSWHCTCELQQELNEMPIQHSSKFEMFCLTPEQYQNLIVFEGTNEPTTSSTIVSSWTAATKTPSVSNSTTVTTTSAGFIYIPTISTATPVNPNETVPLKCSSTSDSSNNNGSNGQNIKWPQLHFIPTVFGALTVKITVEQTASTSTFGLFWFCKTTKEFYMMELLPDEFGLGCYFTMPLQTVVKNLMPNLAYTFCLVDDQRNFISPFSCKSVHISGNLNTYYNAWLSKNVRAKVSRYSIRTYFDNFSSLYFLKQNFFAGYISDGSRCHHIYVHGHNVGVFGVETKAYMAQKQQAQHAIEIQF